jgi:hypothetical protein
VLAVAELAAARFMGSRWQLGVGAEVYEARAIAAIPDDQVRTVYLGDSVARQLFPHGSEPDASVMYLPTNQAISAAGQFYLLRDIVAAKPNVRQVVLMINPLAWSNNLNQIYTHDYFCGPFHRREQILEVFEVTRDWSLLFAHVGRAVLPHLIAANTYLSMAEVRRPPAHKPASGYVVPIEVADVSNYYLRRIRDLAGARGIRLKVLPTPVSDEFTYADEHRVYDRPIVYLPREAFVEDGVHLKRPNIPSARKLVSTKLALDAGAPLDAERGNPDVVHVANRR